MWYGVRVQDAEDALHKLKNLLSAFEDSARDPDIRKRVLSLVPAFEALRRLGKSQIPGGLQLSARDRVLRYFLAYPRTVLTDKELALVAGISEWARRVRELRVEHGWNIITGVTAGQMLTEEEIPTPDLEVSTLGPDDYVLLSTEQDRDAAFRWNTANEIRKSRGGAREKILHYLRSNLGRPVSGEELRYVANTSEWARRTRELRTEDGWPIATKMSGNPTLGVGVYVLESDRQAPAHDRHIPDGTRRQALRRDHYCCQKCGWNHSLWNRSDPRFLEIHHVVHHADGGSNSIDNLVTYCNVCHDEVHSLDDIG